MKKIIPFMCMLLLLSCTNKSSNDITINLKVSNMTFSTVTLANQRMQKVIELDKNGEGTVAIDEDALYTTLIYGEQEQQLFFIRGDRITISFDGNNLKETLQIDGGAAPIAQYLNNVSLEPFMPDELYHPLDEVNRTIANKIEHATDVLHRSALEEEYPEFVEMEKARIKYYYAINLIMHPMGYAMKDTTYRVGDDYYQLLEHYMQEDTSIMEVEPYREFIIEASLILASKDKSISDSFDKTKARIEYVAQHFENDRFVQSLVHDIALRHVAWRGTDHVDELTELHNTYVTNQALRDDFVAAIQDK